MANIHTNPLTTSSPDNNPATTEPTANATINGTTITEITAPANSTKTKESSERSPKEESERSRAKPDQGQMKPSTAGRTEESSADSKDPSKFDRLQRWINERYFLRLNIVTNEIEAKTRFQDWTKQEEFKTLNENTLNVELYKARFSDFDKMVSALLKSEYTLQYDPIKAYFEGLPTWTPDQPDYISQLCSYVTTSDAKWFRGMLEKSLLRTAACGLGIVTVNKQCLTLKGGQNDGKTHFLRYLCPSALRSAYTEELEFNKDGRISLATNFIINLEEVDAFDSKELSQFKAFLSKDSIKLRRPFDKKDSLDKRRASFFGSTNKNDFLTDSTGNVRWVIVETTRFNHDNGGPNGYHAVPIDSIWSQVYALLKSGKFGKLTKEELDRSERNNKHFQKLTVEEQLLAKYAMPGSSKSLDSQFLNATDVMLFLQEKVNDRLRLDVRKMGKALTSLGYKYTSKRPKRIKGMPKPDPIPGYWVRFL